VVAVNAIVLIMHVFSISRVWLEKAYSRPKLFFGDFTP